MPAFKINEILADLHKRIYYPVYLLSGEESYFIDKISGFIEDSVLTEVEKSFNMSILYGKETNVDTITGIAKKFPMAASHNVVIIKEAQSLNKIENLQAYIDHPLDSTILVLNYKHKKIDKRKAFYKSVLKKGAFFESPRIYENQIPKWINEYLAEKQYKISPKAALMLVEFLGTSLEKISNELDKLMINIAAQETISDKHIEEYIGISKDYNLFELQNALGTKNILKANKIVDYFAANPKDAPLIRNVYMLFTYFSKILIYRQLKDKSNRNVASALGINPYFIKDYSTAARNYSTAKLIEIVGILREYDLKAKGVENIGTPEGELYKEMIFKILH
jgi:DNA polymerase-3 subunit delta